MKAIGYAGAQLFGCRWGAYSVVICAPDKKTATEAFNLFLEDRGDKPGWEVKPRITPAKTIGNRPLFWAQVDMTAV